MEHHSQSESLGRHSDPGQSKSTAGHVASSYGIRRTFADDSWVEVSSRPSSSSLSSAAEEIITTGLRVEQDSIANRRRRRPSRQAEHPNADANVENSEEEDESDQVMESSADELHPSVESEHQPPSGASSVGAFASGETSSDDSDANATAIGVVSPNEPFVPRPNTFSLPQNQLRQEQHASHPGYIPPARPNRPSQRHSYPSQPPQHSPFNAISPSHHVDHDAALRASLSTLLSYANAARSLPKTDRSASGTTQNRPAGGNRIDVTTLGLVPESVALGVHDEEDGPFSATKIDADIVTEQKKAKRKADTNAATHRESRSSSKDRDRSRSKKQARRNNAITAVGNNMESVSPTLLTWVVGAGMIVLVSAISFSAGYVVGKDAGNPGFGDGSIPGAGSGEHVSDGVASVTSGLSGNVAGTGGSMRRNLASKGGAIGLGMGWGSGVVGAGA